MIYWNVGRFLSNFCLENFLINFFIKGWFSVIFSDKEEFDGYFSNSKDFSLVL